MAVAVSIEQALEPDVSAIVAVLLATRHDRSIFLRSADDVRNSLQDFLVAKDANGRIVGCAALHSDSPTLGEILSVAVLPEFQGQGIGNSLLEQCLYKATESGIKVLWLATAKPECFARIGFKPISRWKLPASVLFRKLKQVFHQPRKRWWPALLGAFTFMERENG